jgi:WD40 repeat protein
VWSVVFLPDGRRALSGGDPIARLWDVESGKEVRTFKGHLATINGLALSPDGRRVALASGVPKKFRSCCQAAGKILIDCLLGCGQGLTR